MIDFKIRNIVEVLHFTTNKGFLGCMISKNLLSRKSLKQEQLLRHVLYPNSAVRPEESEFFDKKEDWIDFVNLSISEINRRYFDFSKKWHEDANIWWVIMSFDPAIINHQNVYFATTNNSYEHCQREVSLIGFENLFQPIIRRKNDWSAYRGQRLEHLTTCEQAEVLYPQKLSLEWLRRVYVVDIETHDIVSGWVRENGFDQVEVIISPEKFIGRKN